jgi:hypothetical protein
MSDGGVGRRLGGLDGRAAVPVFVGGLRLSELFYEEAVQPILAPLCPPRAYAAALIGGGSEVLGYDTPLSTDHDWGPRLVLFLPERHDEADARRIVSALGEQLPLTFHGYPTRFALSHDAPSTPPRHHVEVHTARAYFAARLGFDPCVALRSADWLTVPEQTLLELTAGAVYHDGPGELTALRDRLAYYPRDLWLYLMAAQWCRIAQQEAFVGRAGDAGDELGSRLLTADIVHDLMRLCFFIERRYAPYGKWFGTAFARLSCGAALGPLFARVLQAEGWQTREAALAEVYAAIIGLHNGLGLTPPLEAAVSPYYTRPYLVIHAGRVVDALIAAIADPVVRCLPAYGGIDQVSDNTDLLGHAEVRAKLRVLYAVP